MGDAGCLPVGPAQKQKKLHLQTRKKLESLLCRFLDHIFEHCPRTTRERRAVRQADIANHTCDFSPSVLPGKDAESSGVRHEQHVGFLHAKETIDGGPVEHDLTVQCSLELMLGNLDVFD